MIPPLLSSMLLILLLAIPCCAEKSSSDYSFSPQPLGRAVKNPLTGWRGKRGEEDGTPPGVKGGTIHTVDAKFETLKKWYIGWNEIETQETDGVQKISDFMNEQWKDLPSQNEKAIPRIVLIDAVGSYAPKDLPPLLNQKENFRESSWYTDPVVQARIKRLISRLGDLWDHDPRVAWVEMGVQGKYGEHWGLGQMPEFAIWLSEQFKQAFKNKKVLVRNVGTPDFHKETAILKSIARDYPFGYYQDSFGFALYDSEMKAIAELDQGNRWKEAVMGGEIRTWKNPLMSDHLTDIEHNLSGPALRTLVDWVRTVHTSHLGWDTAFTIPENSSGAAAMRSALGYHFIITDYQQPREVPQSGPLDVSFSVKNTGSSPFYYKWPIEVSLVDEATHKKVFSKELEDVDIRSWLPGEKWDSSTQEYSKQAPVISVKESIPLPTTLKTGVYVVTLAILDPEGGNLPCVRFEIRNYWQGGLHPMGRIGVGVTNNTPVVDPATFYTNPVDPSVHYEVPRQSL